jgi:lipid-binding SYLF domain-containing protein
VKTAYIAVALSLVTGSAFAAISAGESKRLQEASTVLTELRATPEKGIPQDLWDRANCVVVIPSMKKAGFIFGGEYGKGVASCRTATGWTAPVFMQLQKGSWGAQIGAEEIDLVLLVMNKTGMDKLLQDKVSLGAGASISAGPVGRSAGASTDAQLSAEILSYSRAHGVFAGLDLSGGVLGPDKDSNQDAYGPNVTARQVLVEQSVTMPTVAANFMAALGAHTGATPTATSGREK